jgi:hypothetical protein
MIASGSLVHLMSLARARAIIEAWRLDYNQPALTARSATRCRMSLLDNVR